LIILPYNQGTGSELFTNNMRGNIDSHAFSLYNYCRIQEDLDMFGKNELVSPTYFKGMAPTELMVTSCFSSIQGEGPHAGEPAVFVRFSKCNRACIFCDTWFDSGDILTFDQVLDKIHTSIDKEVAAHGLIKDLYTNNLLIVVSGGEPMLQKNLTAFLEFLHAQGFRTQIESNGDFLRPLPDATTLVVSPKANDNTGRYGELRPDVFARANALKFVVSADPTNIHHEIPEYAQEFRKQKGPRSVFVSPMNMYNHEPHKVGNNATLEMRSEVDERISFWTEGLIDKTQAQANHEYAALLTMRYGYTLQMQMHLFANLP
jgi:7-carboxy-7-deazaguanine synthase